MMSWTNSSSSAQVVRSWVSESPKGWAPATVSRSARRLDTRVSLWFVLGQRRNRPAACHNPRRGSLIRCGGPGRAKRMFAALAALGRRVGKVIARGGKDLPENSSSRTPESKRLMLAERRVKRFQCDFDVFSPHGYLRSTCNLGKICHLFRQHRWGRPSWGRVMSYPFKATDGKSR